MNAAKYRTRVKTIPELDYPSNESALESVDVADLVEFLRRKLPELARQMLDFRMSEGNRKKLKVLSSELGCSLRQTQKLSKQLMQMYRDLNV